MQTRNEKAESYRLSTLERLAKYIEEDDKIKSIGLELGVVGENLLLKHHSKDEKEQRIERRDVGSVLARLGVSYKSVIGRFGRQCEITVLELEYKEGIDMFSAVLDYHESRRKRKALREEFERYKQEKREAKKQQTDKN